MRGDLPAEIYWLRERPGSQSFSVPRRVVLFLPSRKINQTTISDDFDVCGLDARCEQDKVVAAPSRIGDKNRVSAQKVRRLTDVLACVALLIFSGIRQLAKMFRVDAYVSENSAVRKVKHMIDSSRYFVKLEAHS